MIWKMVMAFSRIKGFHIGAFVCLDLYVSFAFQPAYRLPDGGFTALVVLCQLTNDQAFPRLVYSAFNPGEQIFQTRSTLLLYARIDDCL